MINFIHLKNFNQLSKFLFLVFSPILILLIYLTGVAIIDSPVDYQQGNAVKIMYIHVPSAWMSMLIYIFLAIFNLSAFIFRNPFFYIISRSIAIIGASFTAITLITGSIWGKPIWGTYWAWDARLTSMLILFFLYLSYIILVNSFVDRDKGDKISAIIAIVGFVNIPFIKFSVEYWNSLHQPASIIRSKGIAIHSSMLEPLLLSFATFLILSVLLSLIRIKTLININKIYRKLKIN
ncbi:MAG: heme ABC transporter permease CcmC [Rickettsiales bacterium]|jgi:heme exporter protein C|nr:heme ABC transporter permease CcmC [Rickettsiales bacterium]